MWKISVFQCYWWNYRIAQKWLNFQKLWLKWKYLKHFTRPKQQATVRKLFNPPADKSFQGFWNKNFLTEIYRSIQTFASQVHWECSAWASRSGEVQMFFQTPTSKMFAGKFVKRWVYKVEVRKMSEVFWAKLYCKMSNLFRYFLLALRLSARNSAIKR